jgi:3-methyladenine DNA glycosylase AlkD
MHIYLKNLAKAYKENAVIKDAPAMEAYMKNHFKFYGLKSPLRNEITKSHMLQYGKVSYEDMEQVVFDAYAQPYRELHYFAMTLLETHKKNLQEKDIELVKYMVLNNSWWDTVDYIATRGAGELIKKYPSLIEVMDEWSTHENMWLRRIAILHQMKYKSKTDTKRLFSYCIKNAKDKEFSIQKAMGWALREYAYVDANAVLDFVANHTLPNLTVREAKKHFK